MLRRREMRRRDGETSALFPSALPSFGGRARAHGAPPGWGPVPRPHPAPPGWGLAPARPPVPAPRTAALLPSGHRTNARADCPRPASRRIGRRDGLVLGRRVDPHALAARSRARRAHPRLADDLPPLAAVIRVGVHAPRQATLATAARQRARALAVTHGARLEHDAVARRVPRNQDVADLAVEHGRCAQSSSSRAHRVRGEEPRTPRARPHPRACAGARRPPSVVQRSPRRTMSTTAAVTSAAATRTLLPIASPPNAAPRTTASTGFTYA
jgi:hypothetical protein